MKSQRGTQFRIWASGVLRDHLIKGVTINQERIQELKGTQLDEFRETLAVLEGAKQKGLTSDETAIEEKAAHLLYFVIKDHPFAEGNKRIGSFLFILFLSRNHFLFKKNGERKINDNALVALALLNAESKPSKKDVMVKLVINLLTHPT